MNEPSDEPYPIEVGGDRPLIMDAPPSVHSVPTVSRAARDDALMIYTPEPGSPPVWWNPWAALEQNLAAPRDSPAKRITIVAAACAAVAAILAAWSAARAR